MFCRYAYLEALIEEYLEGYRKWEVGVYGKN